ncbi:hypothetical protein BJY01DRAFT_209757 [Aspergillus pseudoustus]|uniref:Uncharacterized protein n=1 Tax=Aspergillus pseudoustus TaxID=1810923 RepID=A0ABR4KEQ1_9EURO
MPTTPKIGVGLGLCVRSWGLVRSLKTCGKPAQAPALVQWTLGGARRAAGGGHGHRCRGRGGGGWQMTAIEQTCLELCVELLNQRHRTHKYESALVCIMSVRGWGEARRRDPDSYPPILSRVIKVARFMVVQKALWLDPRVREIIPQVDRQQPQAREW